MLFVFITFFGLEKRKSRELAKRYENLFAPLVSVPPSLWAVNS